MEDSSTTNRSDIEPPNPHRSSLGAWAMIAVLSVFLVAAGVIGYLGWTDADTSVPTSGYIAMALGVIFSVAVGGGLMALIFFSSRRGYDEPITFLLDPAEQQDEIQPTSQNAGFTHESSDASAKRRP